MKNALGSTRTSFRDVVKWIADRMPTSEISPNYYEYKRWMEDPWKDPISDKSWNELDEGMWGILMDKLEDEARGILLSVPDGEGLAAWAKLWRWYTKTSGLGMQQKRERIMKPKPPQKEE